MTNCITTLVTLIMLAMAPIAHAVIDVNVIDTNFIRGTGVPVKEFASFNTIEGTAVIEVTNGSLEDDTIDKVSSSVINLNGNTIFDRSDFNQSVTLLKKEVALINGENKLQVLLNGKPGGTVYVKIKQRIDADSAAVIGSAGGVVTVNDPSSVIFGAECVVPENAAKLNTVVYIKPDTMAKEIGYTIDFGPSGTVFDVPVTIKLPYSDSDIETKGIISEDDLLVYNFNETAGMWLEVDTVAVDTLNKHVTAKTNHFSKYKLDGAKLFNVNTNRSGIPNYFSTKDIILFVHGLRIFTGYGSHETFGNMPNFLVNKGYNVFSFNYDSLNDIVSSARTLSKAVGNLKHELNKNLIVISHSEGGLVTRRYLQDRNYNHDVSKAFLLGTPNHGSIYANLLPSYNFKSLEQLSQSENNVFLNSLNTTCTESTTTLPSDVIIYNVYNVDLPQKLMPWELGDGVVSASSAKITEYNVNDKPLSKSLWHTCDLGENCIADVKVSNMYPMCNQESTCNHPTWEYVIGKLTADNSINGKYSGKLSSFTIKGIDYTNVPISISLGMNPGAFAQGSTYAPLPSSFIGNSTSPSNLHIGPSITSPTANYYFFFDNVNVSNGHIYGNFILHDYSNAYYDTATGTFDLLLQ